jgi:tRNA (guanine26-N2/guanine27-N2)-dimethyltransferase
MASTEPLAIPEGYTLHSENSAHILLPASADAFLNPVQEFNRDLSVACIRVWGDELNAEKERRWRTNLEKAGKGKAKAKKAKGMQSGSNEKKY